MIIYKLIDVEDDENYVYLCVADDCIVDIEELFDECNKDRERLLNELDTLFIDYEVVFPENVIEVW